MTQTMLVKHLNLKPTMEQCLVSHHKAIAMLHLQTVHDYTERRSLSCHALYGAVI